MILKVFTVFDHAAKAYLQPFFLRTEEEAIRGFSEVCSDPQHMFGRYPDQYTLFHLGEYDDSSASFHELETPETLGNGVKHQRKPQRPWSDEMLTPDSETKPLASV